MQIVDLDSDNRERVTQTADLLVRGLGHSWPDLDSALAEVHDCLQPENINRIAVDVRGHVVGWVGGQPAYDGHAWELHPLVVHPDSQGAGIGRLLVSDFEAQVKARGGLTIYLGTDDERQQTSLGGLDVYPDVLGHLARIQNHDRHPYEFYQKVGFVIVGVIPDANGFGKPDIIMAKRV
ncbi:MAG: GNAT family N-acetyltransferase [Anaerolineales bacterium]|nr:GNAT family N-acetyltransferase [Anaerolineales bacterium]